MRANVVLRGSCGRMTRLIQGLEFYWIFGGALPPPRRQARGLAGARPCFGRNLPSQATPLTPTSSGKQLHVASALVSKLNLNYMRSDSSMRWLSIRSQQACRAQQWAENMWLLWKEEAYCKSALHRA